MIFGLGVIFLILIILVFVFGKEIKIDKKGIWSRTRQKPEDDRNDIDEEDEEL